MIDEMWIISTLLSLVAALFGMLVMIIGWLGSKVYTKLSEMASTMHKIETDLHGKISALDRRVSVVERVCQSRFAHHERHDRDD